MEQCWLVLTFAGDRTYAGNLGYDDDPRRSYSYDSDVQNHTRVSTGDTIVVRDRDHLIGLAQVQQVTSKQQTKGRRRCPTCGTAKLSARGEKEPKFRCKNGHEFSEPRTEEAAVTAFKAHFGPFVDASNAIPLDALRRACPRYAPQASIQRLNPDAIRWGLDAVSPEAARLLPAPVSSDLTQIPDSFRSLLIV